MKQLFGASPGRKVPTFVGEVTKYLQLTNVSFADYLTNKYALCFDLRTSDDDRLNGSGRRTKITIEG